MMRGKAFVFLAFDVQYMQRPACKIILFICVSPTLPVLLHYSSVVPAGTKAGPGTEELLHACIHSKQENGISVPPRMQC